MTEYSFAPASIKQENYLNSDTTITVYGGAAGGGKTYCGLLKHLRWVDDPNYRGVIIRKNASTIKKSGGIWGEALDLYRAYEPKIKFNSTLMKIVFPSGAEVSFSGLETEDDIEKFRGLQLSHAMIDEAVQIQEKAVLMVLSRLRSKAKMVPSLGLTCNPSPDGYLRGWVDWYLYPEGHELAGRADPEKDGKIRYFLRLNNEMIWSESYQELVDAYKIPNLPDDHPTQPIPLSFTFISANIFDNKPLLDSNPQYLANLKGMPRVKQERELWGNWNIREENHGFWKSEWCAELAMHPPASEIIKTVRSYDISGLRKSETTPNPDYTASVKMSLLKDGSYVIHDVIRMRGTYGEVHKHIIENAKRDGPKVEILIPQDPGAAGLAAAKMMQQKIAEEGFFSKTSPTNKSKVDRFRPFCAASEAGAIAIVKNCSTCLESKLYNNNGFFYSELELFCDTRNQKDDMVDAAGTAFMRLAQSKKIPHFLSGLKQIDLSVKNPLNSF